MMTTSKSNAILAIVVVAAIAVASIVAVHGHGGATALGTYGAGNPAAAGLADTSTVASSTGSAATAADPAKQQPTLDQFTSRNPFIQATSAPSGGTTGTTTTPTSSTSPNPSSTSSPTPKAVSADITVKSGAVGATYIDQKVGDKLPPAGSAFKIRSIDSSGVTFELLNGYTVGSGTSTKTFTVAQASTPTQVTLVNGSATPKVYYVTVVHISYSTGGSSSSSSGATSGTSSSTGSSGTSNSPAGHNIQALSIETSNGVPSATITVDGTTFAARTVGQVTSTSWGQIKVIGINAPAQTVTILHADVQITLHVGQSVAK
jgi:hypothetical protein